MRQLLNLLDKCLLSHFTMIILSGAMWFVVGCALLPAGLNFIVDSLLVENSHLSSPFIHLLSYIAGGAESAALLLIVLALFVGYFKGTKVFSKTVGRSVARILSLNDPSPITELYTKGYLMLLAAMLFLGFALRFVPYDVRGFVDVTVGTALIHGSLLYFKQAWRIRASSKPSIG